MSEEYDSALKWIAEKIQYRTRVCEYSSYGLKHIFERETNHYISNDDFKKAMLLSGYMPIDSSEPNWRFRCGVVSKKGRPCSSIRINSERLMYRMQDHEMTMASLARETGYTRQRITRSINDGWMNKEVLETVCDYLGIEPSLIAIENRRNEK